MASPPATTSGPPQVTTNASWAIPVAVCEAPTSPPTTVAEPPTSTTIDDGGGGNGNGHGNGNGGGNGRTPTTIEFG
jgi:hypothetical protein